MALVSPPPWLQAGSYSAAADRLTTAVGYSRSGVRSPATDLLVTQTATPSMTLNVAAGFAIRSQPTSAGAYVIYNDAPDTVTLDASNASLPRRDLVVVRVYDSTYSGADDKVQFEVVTGTPAASPVVPPTPSNALPLATVLVGANVSSVSSASIADARPYLGTWNGVSVARSAAERIAYVGSVIYRTDTNQLEQFDGSSWITVWDYQRPAASLMRQSNDYTVPSSGTSYSLPWQQSTTGYIQGITLINQRITVQRGGRYRYSGFQRIMHPPSSAYSYILNVKANANNDLNGGTLLEARYLTALSFSGPANYTISFGRDLKLNAGEYIECFLIGPAGAVYPGGSKASDLSIDWLGY